MRKKAVEEYRSVLQRAIQERNRAVRERDARTEEWREKRQLVKQTRLDDGIHLVGDAARFVELLGPVLVVGPEDRHPTNEHHGGSMPEVVPGPESESRHPKGHHFREHMVGKPEPVIGRLYMFVSVRLGKYPNKYEHSGTFQSCRADAVWDRLIKT